MSENWRPPIADLGNGIDGLKLEDVSLDTKAVSTGVHHEGAAIRPLVTPIFHTSTYKMESVDGYLDAAKKGSPIYVRLGNPTCEDAECAINALEGGAGSILFSSGMAAITTALMANLKAGDHVICGMPCYSGLHQFLVKYLPSFKIETTFVPAGCDVEEYRKQIKSNTRMMLGESPCNPSMAVLDMEAFGKLGLSTGILTFIDGTFASPYIQQPIKYGVDISMHSCTKYLGGHSDICAGVLTMRSIDTWGKINAFKMNVGNGLSPFDANLLRRGIKTLHVRMERHSHNAQKLAEYLESHPKISCVNYPGLPSHPQHARAKKQMNQFGGMIAFEVKGGTDGGKTLVESLQLIKLAVSLGGVESLIEHPASMTHGPMLMPVKDRQEAGISDGLLRFSVGIEDVDDLKKDLEQALAKVQVAKQ